MMVRWMTEDDIEPVAEIHSEVFVRQKLSREWVLASFSAYPKSRCFVIEENQVLGYIIWTQKSGFRDESVIELEQIAISSAFQSKGLGRILIQESLLLLKKDLSKMDSILKHIIISTRADNHVQKLYHDVLGAEVEARISNLYSADEVLMVAR